MSEELRLEVVCPRGRAAGVREAMRGVHPYEEPVIDVYVLEDLPAGCGMGRIGRLRRPATVGSIITRLKIQSALTGQTIKALVAKILDETLPPLPQESEATA